MKYLFGPYGLILLGVILSAIGTYYATIDQQGQDLKLQGMATKILDQNNEISRLQSITQHTVIGKGYCFIDLVGGNRSNDSQTIGIINPGEYPIYDLHFRLVDLGDYEKILNRKGHLDFSDLQSIEKIEQFGEIGSNRVLTYATWHLPDSGSQDINIFISSRSGFFEQYMRLRKIDGVWQRALQVARRSQEGGLEVLDERIDDRYPKDANGKVQW